MAETNPNARLEAFCDGVFAIAITLLIIDIKIPATTEINNTSDFWLALVHVVPSIFAFVLSFGTILIVWVNHHGFLKLIDKSSPLFIYANGVLLLSVAFMPFPTALVGEYLLTNHVAPAVILYDSTLALQGIGWILMAGTVLKNGLAKSEKAVSTVRENHKFGYFALVLYSLCAVMAFWFPLSIAIITTLLFIFWLIWGTKLKHE
jgi:uncharacterized membrane protein